MKNLNSVFAAWIAVWVIFFFYEVSIARRVARLREEVDRLKQRLRDSA
ncbi:MAG TPA: CcmD family protein [Candidatus Acidoferrales bacterium]|nr:CcmD family protein [Candidatus Acidoferrales bacterium]